MINKAKILVVEDEEAIRIGLIDVLVYHGYQVDEAVDGAEGLAKAERGDYQLLLLDVMLPKMSGFDVCNRIREKDKALPIIMLTAKSSDEDIIHGLKLGADDYVAKPFSVAQLILRIQAVLRRSQRLDPSQKQIFLSNGCCIDTDNLCASLPPKEAGEERVTSLTRKELDVLLYLVGNADRPVSRAELLNKVWGYSKDLDIETRTVDIHVAKLRRKLEYDYKHPESLVTVRGAGYRLFIQGNDE